MNQQTRKKNNSFIPPAIQPALVEFMQNIFPFYADTARHLDVKINDGAVRNFEHIRNFPSIICANHPSPDDPIVLFGLSAEVDYPFYYMTAREVFMHHPSLRSIWLESLGCFSILRGITDVSSLRTTRRLLIQSNDKIVMFPEGEISHQNSLLMSFENGVAQIALDACKAKYRIGKTSPLFVLPVGIVYRYRENHVQEMEGLLAQLEEKLGISHGDGALSRRLLNCFIALLDDESKLHHLDVDPTASCDVRLQQFVEHATRELELEMLGSERQGAIIDRLHRLKSTLIVERFQMGHEPNEERTRWYGEVRRLTRLVGLTAESFKSPMSQEELAELITVLSWEVNNCDVVPRFDKMAFVTADEPIDVMYCSMRRSGRRDEVGALTKKIRQAVNDSIALLQAQYPTCSWVD